METIDIIVPVWNGEKYLGKFIDSILKQSYRNFKIYFVYDESTDNTIKILESYREKYPEIISILFSPERKGLSKARDYAMDSGLLLAKYIMFLDADDYAEKCFLEKLVEAAEKYNADLVMCGLDCIDDETGRCISVQMLNNKQDYITDIKGYTDVAFINPAVWNKLWKRETIEQVRFGEAERMEDATFLFKTLPNIGSIKIINEVLYHYRVSSEALHNNIPPKDFEKCWDYYMALRQYIDSRSEVYSPFERTFELMTFVKCGIGLSYRTMLQDRKDMLRYEKYSLKMMDNLVPGWRSNMELQLRYFYKRSFKANAIAVCAFLYKIRMFWVFVYIYSIFVKLLKKEVRW